MKSDELKLKIIEDLIPKDKSISILDAGCGEGIISKHLYKVGYKNIIAFDLDEMRIRSAIVTQVPVMKICPINYSVCSVEKADYSKADVIISWYVLNYVEDMEGVLRKMYKEMKNGAELILASPNACSLNSRISCLFGSNPIKNEKRVVKFTFKELKRLMENTGFRRIEIYGDGWDIFKGKMIPVGFRNWSNRIIVRCVK